jgi:hypothetical protein
MDYYDIQSIIYSYLNEDFKIMKFASKSYNQIVNKYCVKYNINQNLTIDNVIQSKNQTDWIKKYHNILPGTITFDMIVKNNFMNYIKHYKYYKYSQKIYKIKQLTIKYGNKNIYKYCLENGMKTTSNDYFEAIDYNKLDFLEFLIELKDPKLFTNLCCYCVTVRNLDALKLLVSKNFRTNSLTSGTAALKGYFDILKWLDSINCPIDEWTLKCACHSGNIEIVKWIINEKRIQPVTESLYAACNSKNLKLVKFIKENFNLFWNESHSIGAAQKNSVEILIYIHETYGIINQETFKYACIGNHLDAIKYIVSI